MKDLIRKILAEEIKSLQEKETNPCWDGYEMIGMKEKDGKEVPNCVPIEEEIIQEAEYRGRKVKLNKPTQGDVKKFNRKFINETADIHGTCTFSKA